MLVRVYSVAPHGSAWNTFRHFGPTPRARFDHHPSPAGDHAAFGILYASGDAVTALVEAFQATATIHRSRNQPWLATFGLARAVTLLDLGGAWPTRAGASQALATTDDPSTTQAWSRAIHESFAAVDGILYPSAMRGAPRQPPPARVDPRLFGRNIALFERALPALPTHPRLHLRLDHPGLTNALAQVADAYGYDLL